MILIQVVIAGAGMIGNSVAYHLVKRGWSDIVIIDKGTDIFIINKMDLFTAKEEKETRKDFIF